MYLRDLQLTRFHYLGLAWILEFVAKVKSIHEERVQLHASQPPRWLQEKSQGTKARAPRGSVVVVHVKGCSYQ